MTATSSSPISRGPCILVTGGCGYIGSHTITCLLQSPLNYSVVVADNLSNSSSISLDRVAEICDLQDKSRLAFHHVDVCDEVAFRKVFQASPKFDACIHFAGLKVSHCIVNCRYWELYCIGYAAHLHTILHATHVLISFIIHHHTPSSTTN
jgi:UDP-glucose 4-epimerase